MPLKYDKILLDLDSVASLSLAICQNHDELLNILHQNWAKLGN